MSPLRVLVPVLALAAVSACSSPPNDERPPENVQDGGTLPLVNCSGEGSGGGCECPAGYVPQAGACAPNCAGVGLDCGSRGTCDVANGAPLCRCNQGYAGPSCEACVAGYHLEAAACVVDAKCAPNSCGGHGICQDSSGAVSCTCDEGFTGQNCEAVSAEAWMRTPVIRGMADPDILKENDDLYFISGTMNGRDLAIYETQDLSKFTLKRTYSPNAKAPNFEWCDVWAPDLSKRDGKYYLYFSSRRVPKPGTCATAGYEVATYFAVADSLALDYGPPQAINPGTTTTRTVPELGCPAQGCNRAIRIDSALYDDGKGAPWLFYVWFQNGNNISAFRLDNPAALTPVAGPANFVGGLAPEEEGINEGPDIFLRNGISYLFFSGANFNSQYAMYYVMGNSVPSLTRTRAVRRNSSPVRTSAGRFVETHGHNSITSRRGEYFNFIHQGEFNAAGGFIGRSVYKQRMGFKPNGEIESLNQVNVRWSRLEGYSYSLDVVKRDGTVIGPCVSAGVLGSTVNAYAYTGICPSGGDRIAHKGEIKAFRLYYSNNGMYSQFAETAYDGHSDDAFIELPGGTPPFVSLTWNEKFEANTEYSIDVQRKDNTWVGPCIDATRVGRSISRNYTGACETTKPLVTVAVPDVQRFRVCSAQNGNWAAAKCGEVLYDGKTMHANVTIP